MREIAVYLRVSTRKQETRSQEPDLHRWISAYAASALDREGTKRAAIARATGPSRPTVYSVLEPSSDMQL